MGAEAGRAWWQECEGAIIATARKLAVLLHRLWVSGEVYELCRNPDMQNWLGQHHTALWNLFSVGRCKIEVPMLDEDEYKLVKDYVSTVDRLQDLFVPAQNVNVASLGQPVQETFVLNRCIRFPL
jgi:hypothetical protein